MAPLVQAMREARRAVARALAAEPFDEAAVQGAHLGLPADELDRVVFPDSGATAALGGLIGA
ncbi:MAG: hypothetical protein V3R98_06095 [Alphaproteobacteria bacterium]